MKPTVGINGSFLAQPITGVQRYAEQLARAITREADRSFDTVLIVPPESRDGSDLADSVVRAESGLPLPLWVQCTLPRHVRQRGVDLLWSPGNIGPWRNRNQLLTIHDASPLARPAWFSRAFRTYYRLLWPRLGQRVRRVVTDSNFSRDELVRFEIAPREKIDVVPCGLDDSWSPRPLPHRFAHLRRYVLALGGGNPRKNIGGMVKAWRLLDPNVRAEHQLVVIGRGASIFARERAAASDDLIEITDVDDNELAALYSGAAAFVYPSLYEGFGLPPLEAIACGTVAIVSETSSLPEVYGDAVAYCDPTQPASIAAALSDVLTDATRAGELRARSRALLDTYSWETSARQLIHLFEAELYDLGTPTS